MTIDSHTDIVFFSDLLPIRCLELYKSIKATLDENNIEHRLLPNTKDIWCRDYMPIQIDEHRFVIYKYNPDYLQSAYYRRTITDVWQIETVKSLPQDNLVCLDLVLDGGNVVKCGNRVVMTEKVIAENKNKSRTEVLKQLEEAFQREIVLLPWDKNEFLGHSDGIIHYLGDNRVMITNYNDFSPYFFNKFRKALNPFFEVIPIRFKTKTKHRSSWAYINFLKHNNLVMVPQLGLPEDEQALQQISAVLPHCNVTGIPSIEAVRKGGALNCISWNKLD